MTQPRLAVGYHFYNDFDTGPEAEVRTTYDGPLVLAEDMMVFNVTPEDFIVRMVEGPTRTWKVPKDLDAWREAERKPNVPMSGWHEVGSAPFLSGDWQREDANVVASIQRV